MEEYEQSEGMVVPVWPASRSSLVTRMPLQRSLLDDVPHSIQSRKEVIRRRFQNVDGSTGRVSDSASEPAPEPANPLLYAMRRAGTSGPGVDLPARREASFAVKPHESVVGFFNERAVHRPQSKKKRARIIWYSIEKLRTLEVVYDSQDKTHGENGGSPTPLCLPIPWNCNVSSAKDIAWYQRSVLRMDISADRRGLRLHRSARVDLSHAEIWKSGWARARIRQHAN
eukprot:4014589-Pyramimonas_sp.AAC.1